jgi:hypothetical protein
VNIHLYWPTTGKTGQFANTEVNALHYFVSKQRILNREKGANIAT